MCLHLKVEKIYYRFLILFFNCFMAIGPHYCFDLPNVLQDEMQKEYTCNNTTISTVYFECLGMSSSQFNLLYSTYPWTISCWIGIAAGFFIDKTGNQVGAFLFSLLCAIGSFIFALGAFYKGTNYIFPLMFVGRLIFVAGNSSLTILQNRITSFWFTGKELALAFGITLSFSSLGNVLNSYLTKYLYSVTGLQHTFWIGASFCGLCFIFAIVVGLLDVYGFQKLGLSAAISSDSKRVKFSDIRHFPSFYWLILLTILFFNNGVSPFAANMSKFIKDKYHYDNIDTASILAATTDVTLILSPFFGGFIDIFGNRKILMVISAVAAVPIFGLLPFSYVHPLVSTLWLGVVYSIATTSMLSSIPLVVAKATIGTAMGVVISVQKLGTAVSILIVDRILRKEDVPIDIILIRWKYAIIYLLCNILASAGTSVALNIMDSRNDNVLNMNLKKDKEEAENENGGSSIETDNNVLVDA